MEFRIQLQLQLYEARASGQYRPNPRLNGSVNLTPKWGVTFNGGYDFGSKKITPGTFTLTRDLHCWQMSFNWVPIGFRKSWSFTINVKASMLKDLKYDRNSSFYDNFYDN